MARQQKIEPKTIERESIRKEQRPKQWALRRETKYGIWAVTCWAIAALSILSFAGTADVVGTSIASALSAVFGWGKYMFPIVFAIFGWMFWKIETLSLKTSNWTGIGLFIISYSGIFSLIVPEQEVMEGISEGKGGGYIGLISYVLRKILGPWGTGVVFIGALLISLLLWFDTSLPELANKGNILTRFMLRFRRFRERLQRGWTLRSLDHEQDASVGSEETDATVPIDEEMTEDAAQAIEEAEARLKKHAKAQVEAQQKPLMQKRSGAKPYPIDLLSSSHDMPMSGNIEQSKNIIQKTLATFGIEVEMSEVHVGPTVTQYTLRPSQGVKVSQITTLNNDLALALAAHPIRIEAPIPGKSLVGIEVPNQEKAIVKLRDILDTPEFKKRISNLSFALGKDVAGNPIVTALDKMPHLLIAGATGSGKSVCINTILLSLLHTNSPDSLRIILVDPKRVELTPYNDIPHLLTPVITSVDKTIHALRWVTFEMDRRFKLFEETQKRNLASYNASAEEKLPNIVVVIDELADLMAVAAAEVEGVIIRLAQMARAVGIHLVVATQRPSVDVITGLIKANITSRIAFSVASGTDSRTILDSSGAEKLLGNGDMLFISADLSKPRRIQGAFVTDQEIEMISSFLKKQGNPEYEPAVVEKQISFDPTSLPEDGDEDELYDQAKDLVIRAGKASASYLQRRLRVGYARAARLLDLLEENGVIGPGDGAKPREVYGRPPSGVPFEQDEPAEDDESIEEEADNFSEGFDSEKHEQQDPKEEV